MLIQAPKNVGQAIYSWYAKIRRSLLVSNQRCTHIFVIRYVRACTAMINNDPSWPNYFSYFTNHFWKTNGWVPFRIHCSTLFYRHGCHILTLISTTKHTMFCDFDVKCWLKWLLCLRKLRLLLNLLFQRFTIARW